MAAGVPDPEIVQRLEDPSSYGSINTVCGFILKRLRDAGLIFDQIYPPSRLGAHPNNRGSYGVNVETVHSLGEDIVQLGWSWDQVRVDAALAVQEDPSDGYIQAFNAQLAAGTPKLAPCPLHSIDAGTLTNGHTTLFLRALEAGVPCDKEEISVNGRMSLAHVSAKQPEIGKVVQSGWRWAVLHHSTPKLYGTKLFELLSDRANVSASRSESEVQVLLKIYRKANEYQQRDEAIPWESIYREIIRTKPKCMDQLESFISFVKAFGSFVPCLAEFHKKYVPNERVVPGAFYQKVESFIVKHNKTNLKVPLFRVALLKAEYSCPEAYISGGRCSYISKAVIDAAGRKHGDITRRAEAVLSMARQLVQQHSDKVSGDDKNRLFGKLDVDVVRVALHKTHDAVVLYDSVEQAGHAFWLQLKDIVGDGLEKNPWETHAPQQSASSTLSSSAQGPDGMQAFSAIGEHMPTDSTEYLRTQGFVVGGFVVSKKDKAARYTIERIDSSITLKDSTRTDGTFETFDLPGFLSQFKCFEEETYPTTEEYQGKGNEAYDLAAIRGFVTWALASLSQQNPLPNVTMYKKPEKRVFAAADYKAGQLVLLPESTGIVVVKPGSKEPKRAIDLGCLSSISDKAKFFITPPAMASDKTALNAPFWLVRESTKAKEVTMQEVKMELKATTTCKPKADVSKSVTISVLKNIKAIKKGDELVVLGEPEGKDSDEEPAATGKKRGRPKSTAASSSPGPKGHRS